MKNLILLILLFTVSNLGHAQLLGDANMNNFKRMCRIAPGFAMYGDSFYNPFKDIRLDLSFASGIWMSAKDDEGELLVAGDLYRTGNSFDFYFGPLDENGNKFVDDQDAFDRVWKINGTEIQRTKQLYDEGVLTESLLVKDIKQWPAKGNPFFVLANGQPLQQELAPFYDENGDGTYNPLDGDLPIHSEDVAFETRQDLWGPYLMTFQVFNDDGEHRNTRGERLRVEVQQLNYMLSCEAFPELAQTIFSRYKVLNKSGINWKDFNIGLADNPHTSSQLNFSGCAPELNAVYNYPEFDPLFPIPNNDQFHIDQGFAKTLMLLDKKLLRYISINTISIGLPDPNTVFPSKASDYDAYLNGVWLDGTPMSFGGTGYDTLATDFVDFMFTDFPNQEDGWSMANIESAFYLHDLMVVDVGDKNENFLSEESVEFEFANHVILDDENLGYDVFDEWENKLIELKMGYEEVKNNPASYFDCFGSLTQVEELASNKINLFPNPVNDWLQLNIEEASAFQIHLFDAQGKCVRTLENEMLPKALDVSMLSSGMYFLRMEDQARNVVMTEKFVIAR